MMKKRRKIQKIIVKGVKPDTKFDYKDVALLRQFITDRGKIIGRSRTGMTAKQQRALTKAIKRARILAMLPFAS